MRVESGFRLFEVRGPIPFETVGLLARLSTALAKAEIPLFALSTFDTDYLLVAENNVEEAAAALENAGGEVVRHP